MSYRVLDVGYFDTVNSLLLSKMYYKLIYDSKRSDSATYTHISLINQLTGGYKLICL